MQEHQALCVRAVALVLDRLACVIRLLRSSCCKYWLPQRMVFVGTRVCTLWSGTPSFVWACLIVLLTKALANKHDNTIVFARQPTGIFVLALDTGQTDGIEHVAMQLVEGARIYHDSQLVDHAEAALT